MRMGETFLPTGPLQSGISVRKHSLILPVPDGTAKGYAFGQVAGTSIVL